jgi:hypothetical protein
MSNPELKCHRCQAVVGEYKQEAGGHVYCSGRCWRAMMDGAGEEKGIQASQASGPTQSCASPALPYWLERLLVYYGDGQGKIAAIWHTRGIAVEDFERVVEEVKRLQLALEKVNPVN